MPTCPACSTNVTDGARFCPSCGTPLTRNPAATDNLPPTEAHRPDRSNAGSSDHGRFLPGESLGTRYRIVGLLGRGGMGEVYRADDLELGQSVALKFLPERLAADPIALDRIRREVRTARAISHPNVCRVYDIAEVDGHVFLSMEYVDGDDLSHVLKRLGPPGKAKAIEIARQICLGLGAAHENDVLHRDLKPANIILDGRGRVRISDFGLAGLIGELEKEPRRAGTPLYMAPEQLESGRVSVRSDIYSLGLVLYELFTGKRAFEGKTVEELRRARTSGSAPSMQTDDEAVDPAVERIILRCLEPDPVDRPPSVYAVLAALPGSDPLTAALAAGETPSPELVVNAWDVGGLSPRVAGILLAVYVVSLVFYFVMFAGSTVMPERSPAVLSVVADQVLEGLGYTTLPPSTASGLDVNTLLSREVRGSPVPYAELAARDRPVRFCYWKRWTLGEFTPLVFHAPELRRIRGNSTTPESTVTVALDSEARLLYLEVPPSVDETNPAPGGGGGRADWSQLFRLAGLDEADGTPAEAGRPPIACDEVAAWTFVGLIEKDKPVEVQMGARGGRPVYFTVGAIERLTRGRRGLPFVTVFASTPLRVALLLVIAVLAIRNLRAARGDRRNAIRAALVVGGLYTLLELFAFPFGGTIRIGRIAAFLQERAIGHIILHTLEAWLAYLAVEPYVRRVWPRMLVGLMRVLAGRWRNPAVGREVLVGVTTGSGMLALYAVLFAGGRFVSRGAGQLPDWGELWQTISPLHFLAMNAHRMAWASIEAAFIAGLLVALRLIGRHTVVAAVVGVVFMTVMGTFAGFMAEEVAPIWLVATYAAVCSAALVVLYTRVGILAAVVATLAVYPARLFTADLGNWWAGYGVLDLAIPVGLAAYGFWVALAGRPIFADILAEPRVET